jgi:hypothetical protein
MVQRRGRKGGGRERVGEREGWEGERDTQTDLIAEDQLSPP